MSDNFPFTWEESVAWLKSQADQQSIARSCYYDDPLINAATRFSESEEWSSVLKIVGDKISGKVLDIGAGRGISSFAFAKSGANVIALEPDPSNMVGAGAIRSLSEDTALKIKVVMDYGEMLPFADNEFDIVYGRAVMHHAKDLQSFCCEASRVLKPGGLFLGTREHVISNQSDLSKFLDSHPLHRLYGGESAYLLQDYLSAINKSGLTLLKTFSSYQNPINYAPRTTDEVFGKISEKLQHFTGDYFSRTITSSSQFRNLLGWYDARFSNQPGRLYTFVATK
jgi:ubiquinone/menaquinone biosynthesis C-methylase UbiE